MEDFNSADLINEEAIEALSEEDAQKVLDILTKAGY
jgi:hypothetical protein